jgi:hypothetical protein
MGFHRSGANEEATSSELCFLPFEANLPTDRPRHNKRFDILEAK